MSGPQFVHVETYAMSVSKLRTKREIARAEEGKVIDRKLTVEEICAEAARLPGSHPHVAAPKSPVVIYGIDPEKIPGIIEERVRSLNADLRRKRKILRAEGRGEECQRAVRTDSQVLFTMVASHPIPWVDEATGADNFEDPDNKALLDQWIDVTASWVHDHAKTARVEIVSIVIHYDEGHPHLHVLGIPEICAENKRMEARRCHPGYVAKESLQQAEGEDDKAFKRRQNAAYITAMRSFQDDYYAKVGIKTGLLRTGPKRRRRSNAEYKAEKHQAKARGLGEIHSKRLADDIAQQKVELAQTLELTDSAGSEAAKAIIESERLKFEHAKAEADLAEVSTHVERVAGQGLALLDDVAEERARVAEAREERRRIEAEIAEMQSALDRRSNQTGVERDALERDRLAFEDEKRKAKRALKERENGLARREIEMEAIMEGVTAYAEGRLVFRPEDQQRPFVYCAASKDDATAERLIAVKPLLEPLIRRLDERITTMARRISLAIEAAVKGWADGLLTGLGAPNDVGRPTFHIEETLDGDRLLKAIEPHREIVADVVEKLPDRSLLVVVAQKLASLRGFLTSAEQAEAREFEHSFSLLQASAKRKSEKSAG